MAEAQQTIKIGFDMVDPEGTAALRVVAGHAARLGETWSGLGAQFAALADSLDDLVAGGTPSAEEQTPDGE